MPRTGMFFLHKKLQKIAIITRNFDDEAFFVQAKPTGDQIRYRRACSSQLSEYDEK